MINVADNSGAKVVQLIGIPKKGNAKIAYLGDIFTGVVKKANPFGQVKNGEIVRAVIVRARKETKRNHFKNFFYFFS